MINFYFLIIAIAFGLMTFFSAKEIADFFKKIGVKKSLLLMAAICSFFIFFIFLTTGTALRGGTDNEHDFEFMAITSDNFIQKYNNNLFSFNFHLKEGTGQVYKVFNNFFTFGSLRVFIVSQQVLWLLSGLLILAVLRRAKFSWGPSFFAAAILFLNHNSILNAYAFFTAQINVIIFLVAIYALVSFVVAEKKSFYLYWFFVAAFLCLAARYEFFPVLLFGLVSSFSFNSDVRLFFRKNAAKPFFCAGVLIFIALSFFWLKKVFSTIYNPGALTGVGLPQIMTNIHHHLILNNLKIVLPLSPGGLIICLAALFIFVFWLIYREGNRRPFFNFFILFLFSWILYFSVIYRSLAVYPLQFIRHHEYFFLPLVFFMALFLEVFLRRFLTNGDKNKHILIGLFLAILVYGWQNISYAKSLRGEWRTNDREWQFLYLLERSWPENCRATSKNNDNRWAIFKQYFPHVDISNIQKEKCVLLYRSPSQQVFDNLGDENNYGESFEEILFEHRYYTSFHGLRNTSNYLEKIEPIDIKMGLYYPRH